MEEVQTGLNLGVLLPTDRLFDDSGISPALVRREPHIPWIRLCFLFFYAVFVSLIAYRHPKIIPVLAIIGVLLFILLLLTAFWMMRDRFKGLNRTIRLLKANAESEEFRSSRDYSGLNKT